MPEYRLPLARRRTLMRQIQRRRWLRFAAALILSGVAMLVAWRAGPAILALLLGIALTIICFVALTVAPDVIAFWRGHHWRWSWRAADDEGPFWPGTRIPR
jgi:membrane protein YdbS with pleckstrin-like domain